METSDIEILDNDLVAVQRKINAYAKEVVHEVNSHNTNEVKYAQPLSTKLLKHIPPLFFLQVHTS